MLLASILPLQACTRISLKAFSQQFTVLSFTHYFLQRHVGPGIHVPASSHKSELPEHIVCVAQVNNSSVKKLLLSWGVKPGWTQCTAPSGSWEGWNYGEAVSTAGSKAWADSSLQLLPAEVQGWQSPALLSSGILWDSDQEQQFAAWKVQSRQWKTKSKGMVQSANRYPERKC